MADAPSTPSLSQEKILTALYGPEYAAQGGARAKIQARFEEYIGQAKADHVSGETLKFTDNFGKTVGSERILASNIDTAIKDNGIKIIDGGNGTDLIDFDSYYIDSVRDVQITKNADSTTYTIVVKDSEGTEHTYNVKNIEGFRFVDRNGDLHQYRISDNPKNKVTVKGFGNYIINYNNSSKLTTSRNSDYVKITTAGAQYDSKAGNDIFEYAVSAASTKVTTIDGGEGNDTLLLNEITKDGIKSVVTSGSETTITLGNDNIIKIKNVETIKLKDWAGTPSQLVAMLPVTKPESAVAPSYDSEFAADVPENTDTPEINYIDGDVLMGGIDGNDLKQGGYAAVGTEGKRDIVMLKGCRSDYVFSMDEKGRIKVTLPGNSTRKYMYLTKIDQVRFTQTGQEKYGIDYHDNSVKDYRLQYNGEDIGDKADKNIAVLALSGEKLKFGAKPNEINTYIGSGGNDFFRGSDANDTYKGENGDDVYVMSGGVDKVEDAAGNSDLFVVLGKREDYIITKSGESIIVSKKNAAGTADLSYTTTLKGIERIQFNDGKVLTSSIKTQ